MSYQLKIVFVSDETAWRFLSLGPTLLDNIIWEKLSPFKEFMISWFGEAHVPTRMDRKVLYHTDANRVCVRFPCRDTLVSFEHNFPIADHILVD